jgi:hypothetical protein
MQGEHISVKTAANLVKMLAYQNKDNLQVRSHGVGRRWTHTA